ncbi:glycosyltransferase [Winogradskyella pulchriflava]|uniref:Glycosyltransferase n=1 Tax=Winogradskyella pulchriflava TaxID=1110688 RepID=A0ABV6QB64_9FLAO
MRIIQIIDSLEAGGAERVAVNYANGLSSLRIQSYICVTRKEGLLKQNLSSNVGYIFLNKKSTLDLNAFLKLKKYITKNKIDILHAHSTSYFIAVVMKFFNPKLKIVWHDHYGNSEFLSVRPYKLLKLSSFFFNYILSVNPKLADWARLKLSCKNIEYVKNYPILSSSATDNTKLKGKDGKRVVCLANLREQKNHLMLLEAFKTVTQDHPDWSLHCIGKNFEDDYANSVFNKVRDLNLDSNVYFYNSKSDILNILQQCQVGVLVSKSEGLPLSLLEYGLAKLPVIATDVGDCRSLINDSNLGILIEDINKQTISEAITKFITNEDSAQLCANNYMIKINKEYSENAVLDKLKKIYKTIIE